MPYLVQFVDGLERKSRLKYKIMKQFYEIYLKNYTISLGQFESLVSEFDGIIENEGEVPICYNLPVVLSFKSKETKENFIYALEAYRYI